MVRIQTGLQYEQGQYHRPHNQQISPPVDPSVVIVSEYFPLENIG